MKDLQQYFTEKNILTIFFPGLLATYPLWFLYLEQLKNNAGELKNLADIITPLGVVLGILLFVGIYGIGYFIKRIAIRYLEWHLDNGVEKKVMKNERRDKKAIAAGKHIDHTLSTFNKTWYDYLKTKYGTDKAPIIIEFYNTYIYTYHFELSCIVAMVIQLLFIWLLKDCCSLFSVATKVTISVISILLGAMLYFRSRDSAWESHIMRCYIVGLNDSSDVNEKTAQPNARDTKEDDMPITGAL